MTHKLADYTNKKYEYHACVFDIEDGSTDPVRVQHTRFDYLDTAKAQIIEWLCDDEYNIEGFSWHVLVSDDVRRAEFSNDHYLLVLGAVVK